MVEVLGRLVGERAGETPARGPADGVCLLTSNLSEAHRLSRVDEVRAYVEFCERWAKGAGLTGKRWWIKPHPRDAPEKILGLREALGKHFGSAEVLEDGFHEPFELVFWRTWLDGRGGFRRDVEFLAFGTSALSLYHLFRIRPVLGLGDIGERYVYPAHRAARRRFEEALRMSLEENSAG